MKCPECQFTNEVSDSDVCTDFKCTKCDNTFYIDADEYELFNIKAINDKYTCSELKKIGRTWYESKTGAKFHGKAFNGEIYVSKEYFLLIGRYGATLANRIRDEFFLKNTSVSNTFSNDSIIETQVAHLPQTIKKAKGWPSYMKESENVIVIPKDSVEKLNYSFWGTFDVVIDELTFGLNLGVINRGSITKFLKESRWKF